MTNTMNIEPAAYPFMITSTFRNGDAHPIILGSSADELRDLMNADNTFRPGADTDTWIPTNSDYTYTLTPR